MTKRAHLRVAAPTSNFCAVEVPLGITTDDGRELSFWIDGNSKITAGNGTYAEPSPNALSLPAASVGAERECPGSTESCRASCYVRGLAKHAPDVYALYEYNARTLDVVLSDVECMLAAGASLGRWIEEHCRGGFRWHVSGDVRDLAHARFIKWACLLSSRVDHWIYTRTFAAVPILRGAENLAVNVSSDASNYREAIAVAKRWGVRVCHTVGADGHVPELPDGSVIFPDYPIRGRDLSDPTSAPWWQGLGQRARRMVCPTDFFGQSEAHRCGPCDKCLRGDL